MSLFRLDGFVAFWQVSFFGEMSCVVCREHFVAGLHLSLFVVYFFLRSNIRFAKGCSLESCCGLATILLFVSRWGFKHSC